MWGYSFPGEEEPITYITNGVHTWSWLAPRWGPSSTATAAERPGVRRSNDRRPGRSSRSHRASSGRPTVLQKRDGRVRQPRLRGKAGAGLSDPDALTIGFARRFATYKRATLLLTDPERLRRIAKDPDRPSVPLRRQGSPCRRAGQGVHQGAVQGIRRRLRRAPRDPRGLRYGRCSPPRARR